MGVQVKVCYNPKPGQFLLDLPLTIEGNKLTVQKTDFVYGGEAFSLVEDEVFELEPHPEESWVEASFVVDVKTGELRLLFDVSLNGYWYDFSQKDCPYRRIDRVIFFTVPPNTTKLDDLTINVMRFQDAAPSSAEQE